MPIKILLAPKDVQEGFPDSWVAVPNEFIRSKFKPHVADYIISKGEVNVTIDTWVNLGLPVLTKTKIVAPPLEFK